MPSPTRLLVADTSGKHGSVALVRADSEGKVEVIESVPLAGGTFSAQLVPQIASLLSRHGMGKAEIDAFVVISGPGSFTGLRVGLAAIKALSEILHKPIVPVSLLEVMAVASRKRGKVLTALDAGRGEVYLGEYEIADSVQLVREQLLGREQLTRRHDQMVLASDDSLRKEYQAAGIGVLQIPMPGAEMIARVGVQKLKSGHTVSPEELEANYIRRSDAEIFARH
jgi:tRNA threonylcarbamoyladenosine biosynthesis protein TsaB